MKEKQIQEVANLLAIGREVLCETKRLDGPARDALDKAWRKGLSSKPLIKGMLGLVLLLLASCARPPANTPPPPKSEPIGAVLPPGDKEFVRVNSDNPAENGPSRGITVQPPRTLLDKLTGRTPAPVVYPAGTPVRAGKKSTITINHVTGGQTNTTNTAGKNATAGTGATGGGKADGPVAGTGGTATNIEKAKAPVATGTGDATDQSGTGAASAIKGDNNAPVLTNAPVEAPDWKAQLAAGFATPVGKVLGVVVFGFFAYGVYRLWPLLRRKSSPSNQA